MRGCQIKAQLWYNGSMNQSLVYSYWKKHEKPRTAPRVVLGYFIPLKRVFQEALTPDHQSLKSVCIKSFCQFRLSNLIFLFLQIYRGMLQKYVIQSPWVTVERIKLTFAVSEFYSHSFPLSSLFFCLLFLLLPAFHQKISSFFLSQNSTWNGIFFLVNDHFQLWGDKTYFMPFWLPKREQIDFEKQMVD